VNRAAQNFERLPAMPVPNNESVKIAANPQTNAYLLNTSLDTTETASVRSLDDPFATAHLRWCVERYRSYHSEDDSYTSYSGTRRACVSPYSNDLVIGAASAPIEGIDEDAFLHDASHAVAGDGMSDHIRKCFIRYRSYRPEDNSYQPYGDGPRRQCQ
jgi:hypothetical protein